MTPSPASAATLAFSPTTLNFGNVALTESKQIKTTLKNNTALNVNLSGISLSGVGAADFQQTHNCPVPLPAGASRQFTVTFKPKSLQARLVSLNLNTGDHAMPTLSLPLKGNIYPKPLNDTGITQCNNVNTDDLPCPVKGFPG